MFFFLFFLSFALFLNVWDKTTIFRDEILVVVLQVELYFFEFGQRGLGLLYIFRYWLAREFAEVLDAGVAPPAGVVGLDG